jgi:hypothetical protein
VVRLLRRLLRRSRPAAAADFGAQPPVQSNDAEGWLMVPYGGGWLHFPPSAPVQLGPAVDPFAPVPQHTPQHAPLFRSGGSWHDGTRTP